MSRPEIVGEPKMATGLATTGFGMDFHVPSLTSSNLIVAVGWKALSGAIATIPRVDGALADASGMSSFSGGVGRCQLACWRNLTAGSKWIGIETASGVIDNVWAAAILLRDAGEGTTMLGAFTNPFVTATVPSTSRLLVFYWSYGATSIGSSTHRPILTVPDLGNGLGALAILTGPGSAIQATVGIEVPGESQAVASYGIFPYAAS